MNHKQRITQTLTDFTQGADEADLERLGNSLHPQFTNVQNGFFEQTGVHIIDRSTYLGYVASGKFGGVPRRLSILQLDVLGEMAMVKVTLTRKEMVFHSYISLVFEQDQWKVIGNFPKIALTSTTSP